MHRTLVALTPELWQALLLAKGEAYLQAFLEDRLRRDPLIRTVARKNGIKWQERPQRGRYKRKAKA